MAVPFPVVKSTLIGRLLLAVNVTVKKTNFAPASPSTKDMSLIDNDGGGLTICWLESAPLLGRKFESPL